jgi:type VI secretion system secreted protein VgrG
MGASQEGCGAYNQLVFDDSPGQSRLALQRHTKAHDGAAELNLGQLRHQSDNARLQPAGFGAELKTADSAALRAGQGLLLSSDVRTGGCGAQLDSREAAAQISESRGLQIALATQAQKHNAKLKDESDPAELRSIKQMEHSAEVVVATDGDQAKVSAYSEPHLQLSSPGGIVAGTPADLVLSAGTTTSITAGQDINLVAQASSSTLLFGGISLFTYGKASNKTKPNQEAGIKLHAASGKLSSQSQSGTTSLVADKTVTVASVTKTVAISAPKKHVLLTTQGAYIKLEGGNIEVHAPGKVEFKASKKELSTPQNVVLPIPKLPKAKQFVSAEKALFSQQFDLSYLAYNHVLGFSSEGLPYEVFDGEGNFITSGTTSEDGLTQRILTNSPAELTLLIGDGSWQIEEFFEDQVKDDADYVELEASDDNRRRL